MKLGITHILTIIVGVGPIYPEQFTYKNVSICDDESSDIYQYFDDCIQFIDDAIEKGGKVLVHCMCGISRSATIVAAYLIDKCHYSDEEAINIIKEYRDCINPNPGFRRQLKLYANYIKDKSIR